MEPTTRTPLIVFSLFLILCLGDADAVSCYLCSWTPQDKEVESDRCSAENFDEQRVPIIDCPIGCETVKILDSNGELMIFYRNCLMSSPNKFDYDRVHKKSTIITEEEMFACDSDLCNGSSVASVGLLLPLVPFLSSHFLRLL